MNSLILIVGPAISALGASVALIQFHRGPSPKWRIIGTILVGLLAIGAGVADWVLIDHRGMVERTQPHLDVIAAHVADLKRRIDANVAAVAEPQTSHEPSSAERDQAWRNRVAFLANETAALLKERDELLKEINAIDLVAIGAAAASARVSQEWLTIVFGCVILVYVMILWFVFLGDIRQRRADARAASAGQHGLEGTLASDHVRQLAASGAKIAAIKAYREETGANLLEAKKAIEALSGR